MSPPPEPDTAALQWPAHAGLPPDSLPRRMAPLLPATGPWPTTAARPSAVIVLFIQPLAPGGPARIVLTRRSTTVGSHKGQVGFAGGRAEAADRSPAATALRELHEELGLAPSLVTTVGMLPPTNALDGHLVYPVVGVAPVDLSALRPAPAEVEAVFAEPWTAFAVGRDREFRFNIFGNWRTSRQYDAPGGNVWGLTALLLAHAALA